MFLLNITNNTDEKNNTIIVALTAHGNEMRQRQ
jgi:hypothetical protein